MFIYQNLESWRKDKMDYFKQEVAKFINKEVMGGEFVDKDLDKYIYASLSQPQ